MPDAIFVSRLNLPAGNGSAALFFNSVELGWSDVTKIIVRFPPGCAGLVGARLEYTQHPVYPIDGTGFFIFDDFTYEIDVTNQGNSGSWRAVGYNTDIYPHTVDFYFEYNWITQAQAQSNSPLVSL